MSQHQNQTKVQSPANADMTPLLDIVFILLIFFIVATSFLNHTVIETERPRVSHHPHRHNPAKDIAMNINTDGLTTINGHRVDISRIPAKLETLLSHDYHNRVLVDAHNNTSAQHVVNVLNQIKTVEELDIVIVRKTTSG